MKQLMIDMMAAMMPFMRPLALIAAAAALVALAAAVLAGRSRVTEWGGVIALAGGLFFLACEGAGRFLGFEPTLLFSAPADRVLYRTQWPFWIVGLVLLAVGFVARWLARSRA